MTKKIVLKESDLRRLVKESINRVLKEGYGEQLGDYSSADVSDLIGRLSITRGPSQFSLDGVGFNVFPTQRGFKISCGDEFEYEGWSPTDILQAAIMFLRDRSL
jgi:hypothetical protein